MRTALERVDFPARREKLLFQRDPFGAFARGQLTLLVGQDFRRLPGSRRCARFLCRLSARGCEVSTHRHQGAPSLLTLSSGRLRAALERVDFPARREKLLFQRDPFGAFARGQLTLLVGQDFRRLPGSRRCARFLCRLSARGF